MNNDSIQFLKEYHSSKISAEDLIALQDLCLIYNVKMSLLLVLLYRLNINTVQEDLESPIKHIDLKNIPDNFQQIVDDAKERGRSQGEDQMFKYVESLGVRVVANDRNAIRPKELDIYLPDFQVGIEYDGLYWHKEASLVSKTNKCDDLFTSKVMRWASEHRKWLFTNLEFNPSINNFHIRKLSIHISIG